MDGIICCSIILVLSYYLKCVCMDSIEVFMENMLGCTRSTFCPYSIWDLGLVCNIMFWIVNPLDMYVLELGWWPCVGILLLGGNSGIVDEKIMLAMEEIKLWYMFVVKVWCMWYDK